MANCIVQKMKEIKLTGLGTERRYFGSLVPKIENITGYGLKLRTPAKARLNFEILQTLLKIDVYHGRELP